MNENMEKNVTGAEGSATEVNGQDQAEALEGQQEPEEPVFHQKDVDKIVRDRLARERSKFDRMINDQDTFVKQLDSREKALNKREWTVQAAETLRSKRYPTRLAELVDYTDQDSFEDSLANVMEIMADYNSAVIKEIMKGSTPRTGSSSGSSRAAQLEKAFSK